MANRFNVKLPVAEYTKAAEAATLHVKEIAEKDYDKEVLGAPLPVVVHFYAKDSKPCEALGPRFAAVAEKFNGKANFVKILRQDSPGLATRLGVESSPTVLFFNCGKETGARLTGDEIPRTAVKAGVEALLTRPAPLSVPAAPPPG
jgi:thioredoxin-like negative regulator of GroEL